MKLKKDYLTAVELKVAPARERGLKFQSRQHTSIRRSRRSRKGAWIEMFLPCAVRSVLLGRSRKGAWIEIALKPLLQLIPLSLPQGSVD